MTLLKKTNKVLQLSSLILLSFLVAKVSGAANFDLTSNSGAQQILDTGNTGIIRSGVTLTVSDPNGAVFLNGSTEATFTNYGTISATGNGNRGIKESGSENVILNTNNISTEGGLVRGIDSSGVGTIITNSESISTAGGNADGILSIGDESIITNSGSISTAGDNAYGINSNGDESIITNSGSISTAGDFAYGILSDGDESIITNSGSILAEGDNSVGIYADGADSTIINTGRIIASGSGSYAIAGGGNTNQTLLLGKGSEIIGAIDLGSSSDTIVATGNGISGRVLTSNIESISIGANVAGVVIGEELHTVDPTGSAMLTLGVNKLTLNIQNSINSHNSQSLLASDSGNKRSSIWINVFNSNFERGDDSLNLAYRNQSLGFVGGYDLDNSKGLVFGVSTGDMETKSSSFKTDVDTFFVGGYKNINLDKKTSLNFDLIAGYERYNSARVVVDNINGYETAKANFNNIFISPSATLERKYRITEIFELNPMAKVSYTTSSFGDSKETGATDSNVKTKGRNAQIFNSRIGVNAVLNLQNTKLEVGTGFDTRIIKEARVRGSIDGNGFRYNTNNDNNVNGHYVRAAAYIVDLKSFSLTASFEKRQADGGENEYASQLGARYRF
jgi:hypothetical protein